MVDIHTLNLVIMMNIDFNVLIVDGSQSSMAVVTTEADRIRADSNLENCF